MGTSLFDQIVQYARGIYHHLRCLHLTLEAAAKTSPITEYQKGPSLLVPGLFIGRRDSQKSDDSIAMELNNYTARGPIHYSPHQPLQSCVYGTVIAVLR